MGGKKKNRPNQTTVTPLSSISEIKEGKDVVCLSKSTTRGVRKKRKGIN